MLAKALTCAVVGLEGAVVEVEVDIGPGLPAFTIVGLPDAAVQEAKERVRAAVKNSGCIFPQRCLTVNLAPADLKKEGPAYDLPISVALLLASEQVTCNREPQVFLGELSLDGGVRHTNGILPMVSFAAENGFRRIFVPEADAAEAALVCGPEIYPVASLSQLIDHLRNDRSIHPYELPNELPTEPEFPEPPFAVDMAHVRGQEHAKRALEVAAAGSHNVLMVGPPGAGKTLLARSLPSALPRLTNAEALEVTKIYSVAGLLPSDRPLVAQRPLSALAHRSKQFSDMNRSPGVRKARNHPCMGSTWNLGFLLKGAKYEQRYSRNSQDNPQ